MRSLRVFDSTSSVHRKSFNNKYQPKHGINRRKKLIYKSVGRARSSMLFFLLFQSFLFSLLTELCVLSSVLRIYDSVHSFDFISVFFFLFRLSWSLSVSVSVLICRLLLFDLLLLSSYCVLVFHIHVLFIEVEPQKKVKFISCECVKTLAVHVRALLKREACVACRARACVCLCIESIGCAYEWFERMLIAQVAAIYSI